MVNESHAMTIRLPDDVYEALRSEAFTQRLAMNEIVAAAVRRYLEVEVHERRRGPDDRH